jgi:uncharacterized protein YukE
MDNGITYNPAAVADFAQDVTSRAGQLQAIKDDTSNRTNTLTEFFAGHGATAYFEAQAQMLSGLQGLIETIHQHGRTTVNVLGNAVHTDSSMTGLF